MESGGTKTLTCGIDLDGNIIYKYYNGVGSPAVCYDEALKNIFEGIENVYSTLKEEYELVFIELGISGLGRVDDVDALKNQIHTKYGVLVDIVTDAEMSLHSILKNELDYGILVVSGTGNATCAINNNKFMIVGGGGQLLEEEGSGYSLIHKSVLEIKRKYEHGIPYDEDDLAILNWTNSIDFPNLKTYFYAHTKSEMASFVYNVMDIIKNEPIDTKIYQIAKNNVQKQGFYLATQVTTITDTLKIPNGAILGLVGGFWRNNPVLTESFENQLKLNNKHFNITYVDSLAVMGCYYLALKNWRKHVN
jgi:N-acetylglucosamine kinase-like BadF-type ATPase